MTNETASKMNSPMNKPPAPLMHLGYLDGLRALAALWVILNHMSIQTLVDFGALPLWGRVPLRLFGYGHYAVDLFIVLSGFCLMLPVVRGSGSLRQGALEFFKRRAWRIIPTYYLALAFSLLLSWWMGFNKPQTIWGMVFPITAKGIITHLLLVHDIFGEVNTINYPAWSIAVEWRIYFAFPLLVWGWRRAGAIWTVCIALVCSFLLTLLCQRYLHETLSAHYLGLFVLGMLGADIAFSSRFAAIKQFYWGTIAALSVPIVLFLSTVKIYHGELLPIHFVDYLVGLASMALLIHVSVESSRPLHKLLSYPLLTFIGVFAYSIYLMHAPLMQILWMSLPMLQSSQWGMFAAQVVVGIPFIVGMSYVFFLFCERPFLKLKAKKHGSLVAQTALEPAP